MSKLKDILAATLVGLVVTLSIAGFVIAAGLLMVSIVYIMVGGQYWYAALLGVALLLGLSYALSEIVDEEINQR